MSILQLIAQIEKTKKESRLIDHRGRKIPEYLIKGSRPFKEIRDIQKKIYSLIQE